MVFAAPPLGPAVLLHQVLRDVQQNVQSFAVNLRQAGDRAAEALGTAALPQQRRALLLAVSGVPWTQPAC